jgi:hypothetical protein
LTNATYTSPLGATNGSANWSLLHVPEGRPAKEIGQRLAENPLISPVWCHVTPWSLEYAK